MRQRQRFFFFVQAVGRIILGWSVGKIIIILSFRVCTFKNNIDHQGKETCPILGLPIHYKNRAIYLSFFILTLWQQYTVKPPYSVHLV